MPTGILKMALLAALAVFSATASYVAPEAYPNANTGDPCYDYDFNPAAQPQCGTDSCAQGSGYGCVCDD